MSDQPASSDKRTHAKHFFFSFLENFEKRSQKYHLVSFSTKQKQVDWQHTTRPVFTGSYRTENGSKS